jgi:hypothetical protein
VIGGWAAIVQGSAHITNDLDICYSRDRENLVRLAGALASTIRALAAFPDGLPFVWDATTLSNGSVFKLATDLGIIDLLAEISGVGDYVKARGIP